VVISIKNAVVQAVDDLLANRQARLQRICSGDIVDEAVRYSFAKVPQPSNHRLCRINEKIAGVSI